MVYRWRKDKDDGSRQAGAHRADPGAADGTADDPDDTGEGTDSGLAGTIFDPARWSGTINLRPTFSSFYTYPSSPPKLDVVEREQVRVGWKLAELVLWNGVHFGSLRDLRRTYDGDATAECSVENWSYVGYMNVWRPSGEAIVRKAHDAPEPDCHCGFYAVNDREHLTEQDGSWPLLEVELFGRVIVHEKGFRAQRQRVRCCTVPNACVYCGDEAVGLGVFGFVPRLEPGRLHPVCRTHEFSHSTFSLDDVAAKVGARMEWNK